MKFSQMPYRRPDKEMIAQELQALTAALKNAGLQSPFEGNCLRSVCRKAHNWLCAYDLSGIA